MHNQKKIVQKKLALSVTVNSTNKFNKVKKTEKR